MKREEELTVSVKNLTRPIIGIENRTALEAFDIMVARIEGALAYPNSSPLLSTPKPEAKPAATYSQEEFDEAYEIGKRDGYEEAVQDIDEKTGGDGEYRYCTDRDPDRHTPDAAAMIQRIVDRFEVLNLLDDATKTGRDQEWGISAEATEGGAHEKGIVPCPCTLIEQDEDCPIGYPSMLCGICEGKGHTTQEQVTALACEMIKIASDVGEPEDPFAAWESVSLIQSQNEKLRSALMGSLAMRNSTAEGYPVTILFNDLHSSQEFLSFIATECASIRAALTAKQTDGREG